MKITVIIPTYNHVQFLPFAIESVLNQTHPADEIIVVDDGSTDDTRSVAESYGSRITYVHQKNAGVSAARNHATRLAKGDWVAYLDADDGWFPEKLRRQVQALEQTPGAVLVYSASSVLWPDGTITRGDPAAYVPAERIWPLLRRRNSISMSSVMAHRKTVLEAGGFNERLTSCEDWDLWVRLRLRGRFASSSEPDMIYRDTPTSMSTNNRRMIQNTEVIMQPTLLAGLPGWAKPIWERRIRSTAYYHAAVMARAVEPEMERSYLLRSLAQAPWKIFTSRSLMLLRNLIGPDAYSWLTGLVRPKAKATR